ncbi:pentapeptide repeat-containing protein [Helicobacter sp. T3_23-1056]
MAQNQHFYLEYDSQEKLYVLSINDNGSNKISISDICKECNDPKVFSKGKNDEIIIHEPIKIKYNNKHKNIYINDELSFKNCVFCNEVHFKYITFAPLDSLSQNKCNAESNKITQNPQSLRIDFQHCVFKERVYFTNCTFNANVFFNHAVFYKYADFHESIFNGIVSFYNATFNSAPNFSTCVFSKLQGTDFINAKIDKLKFATIKDFINEYENDKTHKDEIANTTDSKDKITKKHKIRYASNARDSFRTIKNVLIANNNLLDASNWHKLELYAKEQELKLQKPCLLTSPKKWCDLWQLKLYRKTSEHHTDLLKIWHTLMVLNGVFGLLFGLILLFGYCQIDLLKCVNRCLPCDYVFCNVGKICINTLLAFMFIVLFFSVVKGKISRFIFIVVGYIASFIILTTNPKYLFPAVTLFDKSANLSHEATISAIYTALFILMIFSLQKTARKNSIIPN